MTDEPESRRFSKVEESRDFQTQAVLLKVDSFTNESAGM